MEWFRWYTGCATDPKFQVVARRSGQTVAAVLAVWAMLLERACSASERGEVAGFDCEGADILLGLDDGSAERIYETMCSRGLIEQGRITKWEARQPKREREDSSTERVRLHRERQKQASNATCADVTPCNATQRQETPRGEEIRGEESKSNFKPATVVTDVPTFAGIAGARDAAQPEPDPLTAEPQAEHKHESGEQPEAESAAEQQAEPDPAPAPKPKRTHDDHRPKDCPPECWRTYLQISRGFHTDKAEQLGARAPFSERKVIEGAKVMDTLIRLRGRTEDEVIAVLGWSTEDEFWSQNLRSMKALLKASRTNGELKYTNVLHAMDRAIERKIEREMAARSAWGWQ